MEKLSSQQNLDTVFDLATEQNISAREKFEEVVIVLVNNVSSTVPSNLIERH
jgi:hypothetical protein